MTPTEINQAIAEWCGWKEINSTGLCRRVVNGFEEFGVFRESPITKKREELKLPPSNNLLPDYYNDLNAVHEAEKKLLEDNRCHSGDTSYSSYYLWSISPVATAPQRCEALLRAIGKWRDK